MRSKKRIFKIKEITLRNGEKTYSILSRPINILSFILRLGIWYESIWQHETIEKAKQVIKDNITSDDDEYGKEVLKSKVL